MIPLSNSGNYTSQEEQFALDMAIAQSLSELESRTSTNENKALSQNNKNTDTSLEKTQTVFKNYINFTSEDSVSKKKDFDEKTNHDTNPVLKKQKTDTIPHTENRILTSDKEILQQVADGNCQLRAIAVGLSFCLQNMKKEFLQKTTFSDASEAVAEERAHIIQKLQCHPDPATLHPLFRKIAALYIKESNDETLKLAIDIAIENHNDDLKKSIEEQIQNLCFIELEYKFDMTKQKQALKSELDKALIKSREHYIELAKNDGFFCDNPHLIALGSIFKVEIMVNGSTAAAGYKPQNALGTINLKHAGKHYDLYKRSEKSVHTIE